jgi:arylsulfatase A-like enzyme
MLHRNLPTLFFSILIFSTIIAFQPISARAANQPNIVLITLDSVRADRMTFLGSKAKLTSNLDSISAESMIFEQAYSQAPLTVVSHATILSGTYPQTHGMNEFGSRLSATLSFVPDVLHGHGYHTAAFVGSISLDPKNGFAAGFERGFGAYDAGFRQPDIGPGNGGPAKRPASQVVMRAITWLAHNARRRFFLWVNLNDPNAASSDASYDTAVKATDLAVGKLVAALRTNKLYDDALILIAADHGESLGAHGEDAHGTFLYDETVHVPLLLKLPKNQNAGKRIHSRVNLVDVAPTLLEMAGLPVPSQMQGQSLMRIAKGSSNVDQASYAVTDFPARAFGWSALESWRAGKYLYIKAPRPELYDQTADPSAARNLSQSSKATIETIAAQLDGFDRRFSGAANAKGPELSSSEMQKLASLGYVGLQKSSSSGNISTGVDPKDGITVANKIMAANRFLYAGKPDKAIAALHPVMAGAAKMYLAQYVMGVALAQQKQYPQSIERLRAAIELQPDSAWAHYQMGSSLLQSGDYKTAVIHLEIATSRLPNFAETHLRLAQTYEHLGRADEGTRERSRAASLK